jgi:putative heme-binding domain-containing protein
MQIPSRCLVAFLPAVFFALLTGTARAEWSWIWAPQPGDPQEVILRHGFEVPHNARDATLIVSCDNHGRVTLNGQSVLSNSDWQSPSQANVTRRLRPGRNELRVEARNEGGPAAFLARLRFRTPDGRQFTIETDETWEAAISEEGEWRPARIVARYGDEPWGDPVGLTPSRSAVVQPQDIAIQPGFKVELLHVVSKLEEGSWVSLTVDPAGRIIACDQYGSLYRLTPPPIGSGTEAKVDQLENRVGGAHGLLYAFDSLYVMINEQSGRQGLWRLRDRDGDGDFEEEQMLRKIEGSGEHGPHAIIPGPDGHSLYVVSGNHTKLPEGMELSRAPRRWDEDQIISRMWDANGHARGILAPGGYICRTDPDGKTFELISYGYRNAYDIAFNAMDDLITFDSDMEWDAGAPWYRPTRICLATSGSDLGWRSGSGKWPTYYPDSLPGILDIGPGSPTGVESGRGSKFPARYQHAIFANDWTYGTMYAIHLTPDGAGYRAIGEEFLSAQPLPLTDLVVNPHDGALYFAIGGRRTQSAVYRVHYAGGEDTAPAAAPALPPDHALRRELESLHLEGTGTEAITKAWPHLGHRDRWVRYAARIAVERQPAEAWVRYLWNETKPWAVLEGAVALARTGEKQHRDALLDLLHRLEFAQLSSAQRLALLRAYQLAIIRMGEPEGASRERTIARLDALFPSQDAALNRELSYTLIALDAPTAVPKTMQLLGIARTEDLANYGSHSLLERNANYAKAFSQAASSRPNQQQIAYAYGLREATTGWTPALRRAYFSWFPTTQPWQGGNSFRGFLNNIRKEALAKVSDSDERAALETLSTRVLPTLATPEFAPPRGPGRDYSLDEIVAMADSKLRGRDFEDGRRLYHSAACASCHPFSGAGGGVGPDLTGSGSRFSLRDLVENIVEPSRVISDQYGSEQVELVDGTTLIGRTYEENGKLHVTFDPRNPEDRESADLAKVKSRQPYPVSLMPTGLLNPLNADEVLNLIAYIQSGGNPDHPMFKDSTASGQ